MEKFSMPLEIEHYEKKIYDLKQLIDISKGLNSTLDYTLLIESVLLTMMGQMHIYKAGIFLHRDIEDSTLYLNANFKGFDPQEQDLEGFQIQYESDIIQFFDEHNQCLISSEVNSSHIYQDLHFIFKKLAPEIIVPLRAKGRIAGLIILGEKLSGENYSAEEKDFLLTLASIAAIAVENARLYELATVDMMTRLRIHHYFQTRLKEERDKAKRNHTPLCLFLTDIDHFKDFNDTYGHQIGDLVLKEVARVLARTVRSNDVPARYGGEEFAAILPNTNIQEAAEIAERVRKTVETTEVETSAGKLKVKISVGVTRYEPDVDHNNRDIIEKSDKALYRAKKTGRNRVVIYNQDDFTE